MRMGTVREGVPYLNALQSLSDPDCTSSSEQSCDTVIYVGQNGRALSDRELTDGEGPPRVVPRIPRRAKLGKAMIGRGSRSSGDESTHSNHSNRSNSSNHSNHSNHSGSSIEKMGTPRGSPSKMLGSKLPTKGNGRDSPLPSLRNKPTSLPQPGVVQLPRKFNVRQKPPVFAKPKASGEGEHNNANGAVSVPVNKVAPMTRQKVSFKEPPSKEAEQWVDGPGAVIYPAEKQESVEQWVDGPQEFLVSPTEGSTSCEQWIDGPKHAQGDKMSMGHPHMVKFQAPQLVQTVAHVAVDLPTTWRSPQTQTVNENQVPLRTPTTTTNGLTRLPVPWAMLHPFIGTQQEWVLNGSENTSVTVIPRHRYYCGPRELPPKQ